MRANDLRIEIKEVTLSVMINGLNEARNAEYLPLNGLINVRFLGFENCLSNFQYRITGLTGSTYPSTLLGG